MSTPLELQPDEVILQPNEYDLPEFITGTYRITQDRYKQPVKITKKQLQYFGEKGIPWVDIEKFYCVDRTTLTRHFVDAYEKGWANVNIALRSKMIELALSGNPTMLIWLAKNRLGMSDNPSLTAAQVDATNAAKESISKMSRAEIEARILSMTNNAA